MVPTVFGRQAGRQGGLTVTPCATCRRCQGTHGPEVQVTNCNSQSS